MNSKHTYKAFTLWEVMIAMVITSLIVTLSYGAYHRFTNLLTKDQESMNDLHEMMFLERDLYQLTDSCLSIEMVDDMLFFNLKDTYSFIEFSDSTMNISADSWKEEREYPIDEWSVKYMDDKSDYIKSFQISCVINHLTYDLTFGKTYPRSFLYSMNSK